MSMPKNRNNSVGFIVAAFNAAEVEVIKPVAWVKKKARGLALQAYRFGVTSYKHAMSYKLAAGSVFSHKSNRSNIPGP